MADSTKEASLFELLIVVYVCYSELTTGSMEFIWVLAMFFRESLTPCHVQCNCKELLTASGLQDDIRSDN